jgi:predicted secreted protein with PEFG-CTERM motif
MNSYMHVLIAISVLTTIIAMPAFAAEYGDAACPGCGFDFYDADRNARYNEVPMRAWTDRSLYDHDSEIVVQGVVANLREMPITIRIIGPQGNLVGIEQVEVSEDKTFETTFSTSSPLFSKNGIYTIRVQYGVQEINDKLTVELLGPEGEPVVSCGDDELTVESDTDAYCVPYSADGVTASSATVSRELSSIMIRVDAELDGTITLMIPRDILDSTSDEGDTDFIVLIDDEEADFEEIDSDDATRTLEIMVPEGTAQVEIIGTYAVPEFGTMAAIILAVAIVSIIAVSARTRLVLPKY